jgi:hypothetical protein
VAGETDGDWQANVAKADDGDGLGLKGLTGW